MRPLSTVSPSDTPPADAALLLQAVAAPLLQVAPDGRLQWLNAAAARALQARAGDRLADLWADGGAALALCSAAGGSAELGPAAAGGGRFQATSSPLAGGGWLFTLQPGDALHAARADAARLEQLLSLARHFGRLGVWERNVRTMRGRWDAGVLRFWGLPPDVATPDFDAAAQNIVEADRAAVRSRFEESLGRAGHYAMRYRVRAADGTTRRIHSQWLVKDGDDGQPEHMLGVMLDDSEPYALAHSSSELESQLALAAELGGISVWRHDLLTGRTYFSDQGWTTLGLQPQPEGLTLDDVRAMVHPDDLPGVVASAEAALHSAQPVDVEARYRHADGSWRSQMLRRIVLRDAAGQPVAVLGVALDITERLAQRRRADELSRRLETVTRAAGIGHWLHEPGQMQAVWSDQLRLIFGLSPDDPIPTMREWLAHYVHPDDSHRVKVTLQEWVRSGAPSIEFSFRALRRNGELLYLLGHSLVETGPTGQLAFGVLVDLTEQHRSSQALRNAEQRVALAARGAGLGTWELDLDTLQVHWDEQMWRLRGRTPQPRPMTEAEWQACVHPEDRERVSQRLHEAMARGTTFEHEFRVIWPDGQERWLASRSMEIQDAETGRRRRIAINWDITDSRTADTVRREREIAMRENVSKSRFLARMSHELRTPLNAVLGFSQLLLSDEVGSDPGSASRRRRLDHIRSAGLHLLTLINDALDLSGLQAGEVRIELEAVALRPLVEQTLPMLGPLQAQRPVTMELGALDLQVRADATRLRQVLLNLLSNAVKYNRPGGSVRVDARRDGQQVRLRVSDTGRGLTPEQLAQLFEPFNRLGAEREGVEGSGIGLAIVKALVERMGGSVHVESRAGVGSVFELVLAAAEAGTGAAALPVLQHGVRAPGAAPSAEPGRQRCVLYIEDNPVNALIIGELMARRSDLVLHVAVDGSSGVTQARNLRPDLVLLDMQLPDFDGYEVLRRLRAEPLTAGIPCIALSANAMPEDIERALRAGMSDYWTKPLDFKAFMASLDVLFGKPA